jgi:hypothetical protein
MKAIFRSGDPDPLRGNKSVEITTILGQVGNDVDVQGITIKPQDARTIDLWYNPVMKRWSIGYNISGERVIIDLPELENV